MRITALALLVGAMTPVAAQAQEATALSLDRLAQDVVANNPERQFYQRQIETAGVERNAAGRWADPEAVVEFGQRSANDRTTGALLGGWAELCGFGGAADRVRRPHRTAPRDCRAPARSRQDRPPAIRRDACRARTLARLRVVRG